MDEIFRVTRPSEGKLRLLAPDIVSHYKNSHWRLGSILVLRALQRIITPVQRLFGFIPHRCRTEYYVPDFPFGRSGSMCPGADGQPLTVARHLCRRSLAHAHVVLD